MSCKVLFIVLRLCCVHLPMRFTRVFYSTYALVITISGLSHSFEYTAYYHCYMNIPVRSLLTQLSDLDVFVATGNLSGGARITNNIVLCFSLHRFEVNTKLGLPGHPFTMQADKAWYCKPFVVFVIAVCL